MGIKILKGLGRAYEAYQRNKASKKAFKKMKKGTSTRDERIKFGKRSPDIKSVKPSKKSAEEGREKVASHFYIKNIDEIDKHKKAIKKGEEAKKKIQHMKDTKRAYSIGSYDAPTNPRKGSQDWDK
jgi:hypothetical protein